MSRATLPATQACPSCDKVGTLERVARSEWYACRSCARTFLIHNGEIARRGTPDPWYVPIVALVLCALLTWPGIARAEMPRVSVQVGSRVSFYRSTSRHLVELRVPRNAENRMLTVTLYADGFLIDGPAEIPHEGEDAIPVRTREYRRLAPGRYVVMAALTTATGKQINAKPVEFVVLDAAQTSPQP
jgi:hypothetical protein